MIRSATLADAADIARPSAQLGQATEASVFKQRLRRITALPTHAILIHEGESGRLAGFIGVEQRLLFESGDRVEIVALVVDAGARRGGTGRRLVMAAEDWARARGIDHVLVRSNIARAEAHAFYPALGYARSKTQHVYLRQL